MRRLINKVSIRSKKLGFITAFGFSLMNPMVSADDGETMCVADETGAAISVQVSNIRYNEGNLRAQIYGSNPDDFLAKGTKLYRIDVPVKTTGQQEICVPVPEAGTYALVVMHDRNKNGKADFFTEGFGFSNNPKLKFSPPDAEDVMIEVPLGVLQVPVELYYILGSDNEDAKKRRKMRRR
ncbi:MAG: DUF2141 domain-containing protein [Kordiimonas sp.]